MARQRRRQAGPSPAAPTTGRSTAPLILALMSGAMFLAGFVFIGFYVESGSGPHLRYLGTGFLTACAAFVAGCLVGLVVGIPRFVSSGAMRHDVETRRMAARAPATPGQIAAAVVTPGTAPAQAPPVPGARLAASAPVPTPTTPAAPAAQGETAQLIVAQGDAGDQGGAGQAPLVSGSQFSPSTNLAEISDWLTKLLLGAGLVELTRLGHPISALINAVARGLQDVPANAKIQGTPVLVAGGILVLYVILGFLDGYVITTVWYGKYLENLDSN